MIYVIFEKWDASFKKSHKISREYESAHLFSEVLKE